MSKRIKAYLWNYLIWHLWFTGWLLIIWKTGETKRLCMILCWMVFNDLRKSKEIFCLFFKCILWNQCRSVLTFFFPTGIYCYISYMKSCRYTRRPKLVSDYIMSIYICHYYVEVTSCSLWVCPYLGPSSANLSRCSSIIGGRLLNF